MTIQNRYEFVYLFDVANGNPNGDPDAGNLPRLDPETGQGLVTDVCLKRKVRNFVDLSTGGEAPNAIYVQERAVLNQQHEKAYRAVGLPVDKKRLPKEGDQARALTRWMCDNFYDIRTFGAVMTTEVNCGQVRGPIQMGFARSIDTIVPLEISITRSSVTNEKDAEKERTIGRKHVVPYGLYRAHGFISAHFAERTGFSEEDLKLFWDALINMFDHDRSALRGEMAARKLIVFKHASRLGEAPAQQLLEAVTITRANGADGPARNFSDYTVKIDHAKVTQAISVMELV
jgi:CRISPR-associated protein Csd2